MEQRYMDHKYPEGSKIIVSDNSNHMFNKVGKIQLCSQAFGDYVVMFSNGWRENYKEDQINLL